MRTNETRLTGERAGPVITSSDRNPNISPADDAVPQQLHRRREASLRLPPLADGRRDPLDILVSYSSEPLRLFWRELHTRGLLTPAITNELVRLARRGRDR
jgi:hypothetical protein